MSLSEALPERIGTGIKFLVIVLTGALVVEEVLSGASLDVGTLIEGFKVDVDDNEVRVRVRVRVEMVEEEDEEGSRTGFSEAGA